MPVPVICVGNLTVGGSGKTPVVAALMTRLAQMGAAPAALYRGYGGRLTGPVQVAPDTHGPQDVGDEALLTAAFGPAWVARDRAAGILAAHKDGADIVVMDDGFQNPTVAKDLSLVVIDAESHFGNGRVIPAGPLREPVAGGLARADMLITLGPDPAQDRLAGLWPGLASRPRLRGRLEPIATGMPWQGLACLAFAGIGRPEKFFATLRAQGARVLQTRAFPDHAAYPRPVLQRLLAEAKALNAQLVTTEKDAIRLPADIRAQVLTLPVRLSLDDWAPLDAALAALIDTPPPGP